MKTLKDLFLEALAVMYDAEHQIVEEMPKFAKAATCHELRAEIRSHLKESESHVRTLKQVFECFDVIPHGKACVVTAGLLDQGCTAAEEFKGSPAINTALNFAAQQIEHHEIAAYGGLHEWAVMLGNDEAAQLLLEILEEEEAAHESLTDLAHASSNEEALGYSGRNGAEVATEKPSWKHDHELASSNNH